MTARELHAHVGANDASFVRETHKTSIERVLRSMVQCFFWREKTIAGAYLWTVKGDWKGYKVAADILRKELLTRTGYVSTFLQPR